MDGVREYLLAVSGAALLCGVINCFLGKERSGQPVKVLTGLLLVLTIMQPLGNISADIFEDFSLNFSDEAQAAAALGEKQAQNALADIIKAETGAYILQKANEIGIEIQVTVEVTDGDIPTPVAVRIAGAASPFAKIQLQSFIEQQLGISKENQKWT